MFFSHAQDMPPLDLRQGQGKGGQTPPPTGRSGFRLSKAARHGLDSATKEAAAAAGDGGNGGAAAAADDDDNDDELMPSGRPGRRAQKKASYNEDSEETDESDEFIPVKRGRRNKKSQSQRKTSSNRRCSVAGCDKYYQTSCNGMCRSHFLQTKASGSAAQSGARRPCAVPGCPKQAQGKANNWMCRSHFLQTKASGSAAAAAGDGGNGGAAAAADDEDSEETDKSDEFIPVKRGRRNRERCSVAGCDKYYQTSCNGMCKRHFREANGRAAPSASQRPVRRGSRSITTIGGHRLNESSEVSVDFSADADTGCSQYGFTGPDRSKINSTDPSDMLPIQTLLSMPERATSEAYKALLLISRGNVVVTGYDNARSARSGIDLANPDWASPNTTVDGLYDSLLDDQKGFPESFAHHQRNFAERIVFVDGKAFFLILRWRAPNPRPAAGANRAFFLPGRYRRNAPQGHQINRDGSNLTIYNKDADALLWHWNTKGSSTIRRAAGDTLELNDLACEYAFSGIQGVNRMLANGFSLCRVDMIDVGVHLYNQLVDRNAYLPTYLRFVPLTGVFEYTHHVRPTVLSAMKLALNAPTKSQTNITGYGYGEVCSAGWMVCFGTPSGICPVREQVDCVDLRVTAPATTAPYNTIGPPPGGGTIFALVLESLSTMAFSWRSEEQVMVANNYAFLS